MKSTDEIQKRISDLRRRIELIETARQKEVGKQLAERKVIYLLFLYRECAVIENALAELNWVLKE